MPLGGIIGDGGAFLPGGQLDRGAMLRKGKVGTAAEDGVTDEMSVAIGELGAAVVADDAALTWLYEGGPLP